MAFYAELLYRSFGKQEFGMIAPGSNFLDDPEYFLHRIKFSSGEFEFIKIPRNIISDSTFLDDKTLSKAHVKEKLSLAEVAALEKKGSIPLPRVKSFIFHIGFCCSTLLARALDNPGAVLAMREPNICLNLADFKRYPQSQAQSVLSYDQALDLGLRILNKPFEGSEKVLIKPPNITNNLMSDIMSGDMEAKAVLLFIPLKGFLVSILKKKEPGRAFARKFYMKFGLDQFFKDSELFKTPFLLTDLQVVAFLWILQIQLFQNLVQTVPERRLLVVNCERFIETPADSLIQIARFFGYPLDQKHFENVVDSPVFNTDSKSPGREFSNSQHEKETESITSVNKETLDAIIKWSAPYIQNAGISSIFSKGP